MKDITKSMLETARHEGVVAVEDTQHVIVRIFQHQAETKAMVADILRLHGDLIEDVPQLGLIDIFHDHDSTEWDVCKKLVNAM